MAEVIKGEGFTRISFDWSAHVPTEHISLEFLQMMINRMIQGFFKYGLSDEISNPPIGLKNAERRIRLYKETGNTEWLVDAANYLMIEFKKPSHKKAHFRATSTEESPGSLRKDGRIVKRKDQI